MCGVRRESAKNHIKGKEITYLSVTPTFLYRSHNNWIPSNIIYQLFEDPKQAAPIIYRKIY